MNNHERWTYQIDEIIPKYDVVFSNDEFTHELFGKRGIKVISVPLKQREILSGTDIRVKIRDDQDWFGLVPEGTKKVLLKINARDRLTNL